MNYKVAIFLSVCFLSCMCAVGGNRAKASLPAKSADQRSSMVERPTTSSSMPWTGDRSETSVTVASSETHVVDEAPFLHWDFHGEEFDEDPTRRPMARILGKRWPNKTVTIGFDEQFPHEYRPKVYEMMETFNKATCLKFVNATDASPHYVKVTNKKKACSAVTGYRDGKRTTQRANFHELCFQKMGIIFHELMHAIGFPHQQVRADRDEYVKIHEENIDPKHLRNFKKMKGKNAYLMTVGISYDYNSIMQYPKNAFSNGKGPTITVLKPHEGFVGQRDSPSRSDIASINRLYECWDHYLGDDIPDAVPYEEFHAAYMAQTPNISSTVQQWSDKMTKRDTSVNQATPASGEEVSSVNKPSDPVKDKEEERNYQATIPRIENPATEQDSLIKELKAANESSRQEIEKLRQEIEKLRQENLELRKRSDTKESRSEFTDQYYKSILQGFESLRREISDLREAQEKLIGEMNSVRQENENLRKSLAQMTQDPVTPNSNKTELEKEKSECTMVEEVSGKSVPVTEENLIDLVDNNGWEMRSRKPKGPATFVAKVNCPTMSVRPFWLMKGVCTVKVPEQLKDTTNGISSGSLRQEKLDKLLTDGSLAKVREKDPNAISVKCTDKEFFVASRMTCKAKQHSKVYYLTEEKANNIRMTHKHVGPNYHGEDLVKLQCGKQKLWMVPKHPWRTLPQMVKT
ncbi:uncharacterized protein [Panulirus ornatus]|uniref:uncharacterized protein n=1 Tax=Panulirus ornatus TaxID=150431 RepID=UPI003A88CFCB